MKLFDVKAAARLLGIAVCLASAFFLFSAIVYSQQITGSISGTVTDTSGAVITNAAVTIHNDDTGTDIRTVHTDASGVYHATLLPIGRYTLSFSADGFQTYIAKQLNLHVGTQVTLSATLKPGAVTQQVTVTASSTPVDLSNGAQQSTITGTQIRELELNNRNFEQLVTLQPGVSSSLPNIVGFGIENTDSVSVNGARPTANNWTVDGADVNDSGSNATLLNVPSVDALQEFTLARSTYDAQYGRSGGGQINVMTKSGTNQFHGDAYEFDRNSAFDATPFFTNESGGTKPPLTYNDFGFTFGGPFYIPNVYNTDKSKTFFFVSEEWRRTGIPETQTAILPTAGELQGNFNGIATLNPALAPAGCITNNVISPSCFSHNAQAYIQNVYSRFQPNVPGTQELITSPTAINNFRQDIVRVDQQISQKVQVFARWMDDQVPTTEPGGLFSGEPLPGISSTATNAPGKNFVAHVTAQLSPNIVNESAFNYTWGAINSNITGIINNPSFLSSLNETGFPYTDPYGRVPGISISGLTGVGIPVAPYFERNIDKEVYDNLSLIDGNHSIRTGFDAQVMRKSENAVNPTNGNFSFNGSNGLNPFADFLLGQAQVFSQANRDIVPNIHFTNFETYVQDDWKVRPNFTLNIGVRYSFLPTPYDSNGILDNFDPALFNPALAPAINPATGQFVPGLATPSNYANGIIVGRNGCITLQGILSTPKGVAGPACSPYGNEVNPSPTNNFAPRFGFAWDPFKTGKTSIRGGYGIYYDRSLNGIWEQNQFQNPPFVQSISLNNASFDNPSNGVASASLLNPNNLHSTGTPLWPTENFQDWNFSIQREITPNTMAEVAYVGSKGTNLIGIFDFNQVPEAARLANPTAAANALRPFPGYNAISTIGNGFNSEYNSLQASLNHRMSHGLTMGIAYTWENNLTNASSDRSTAPYDTYNFANNYGPANFNRGQVFVANYVYDLPFFLKRNDLIGRTLGGWEVSGITSYETGFPTTIFQFTDPFDSALNGFTGIGIDPSVVAPRPDVVPGQNIAGPRTIGEFFNPAAFTEASGHFGTAGRGLVTGPGTENWDLALMKNIRFSERFSGQLRGEFFNAFNHTNPNAIDNFLGDPTFGQVIGTADPRIIQFGFKLYF
jgi:hypothetical protein